ncbi:MAG: SprB repeat-containing protein [Saprospiraceae bacterium]|nr:SprB repeat-containing protein [Saprospiraceae bacterium]
MFWRRRWYRFSDSNWWNTSDHYAWEDGDGNPVGTTNLEAGTYHVTATDAAGCTIESLVVVSEPSELTITGLIITDVNCNGGNDGSAFGLVSGGTPKVEGYIITVQGSGAPETTTDFGFNFSDLVADGYELTIEDSLGCTITTTFTINEPTAILVTATATDAPCFGGNGEITGNASGGTPGYTYFIDYPNDGQASPVFSAPEGTYTLVVEDTNDCTASTSVTVGEPAELDLSTTQTNETCAGEEDGSITVDATGGTPGYTYEWSDGQTTAIATGLAAGMYTVTVTDNNGCTTTISATLTNNPLPTFATGEPFDLEACATVQNGLQGSFDLTDAIVSTLGTITYHVSQSDATDGIGAIGNTTTYTGNDGQEVWVRVVDGNGCFAVGNLILTVNPLPVASIAGDLEICNGESTTLTASGGTGYAWSSGDNTAVTTVSPVVTTAYTVTVTDANGCQSTATVTVVVNQLPVATIAATDMVICLGENTTLTASGGSTYAWSTLENTASITVSPVVNTTYTVTVTDIEGCQSSASKLISISPAMTWDVAEATDASCYGGNDGSVSATVLGGTAPVTFAWEDGDGNPVGTTNLEAGTYHVTATDNEGCSIDTLLVVGQPTQIEIFNLLLTNVICNGDTTGSAFATIIGGTPSMNTGYTVTIQGSGAPQVQNDFGFYFANLPADGYEVTVEDSLGCTITAVFTITEPTPLVVTGTTDDALCAGGLGTITAFASGGTTGYLFFIDFPNDPQASPVFNAVAGTYNLVVEDSHSCRDTVEVIVGEPAALALTTSTTNETCEDANDGTATVAVGGGTPGYTYVWSNGQTTAIATGLGEGSYTVTVTDINGCSATATVAVALTGPIRSYSGTAGLLQPLPTIVW